MSTAADLLASHIASLEAIVSAGQAKSAQLRKMARAMLVSAAELEGPDVADARTQLQALYAFRNQRADATRHAAQTPPVKAAPATAVQPAPIALGKRR